VALALAAVWGGLVLAAMVDLPPSFFIVSLAVFAWVVVLAVGGRRRRRPPEPLVDAHHRH
jgi:zinc/manganese transport system permease protein